MGVYVPTPYDLLNQINIPVVSDLASLVTIPTPKKYSDISIPNT